MDLVVNFFCALSECYHISFPATLHIYKSLLEMHPRELKNIGSYFESYLRENKQIILDKKSSELPKIQLPGLQELDIASLFDLSGENNETIWSHFHVILKAYFPTEIIPQTSAPRKTVELIENIVSKISTKLPPVDETLPPQQIMQSILQSPVFMEIFADVQNEMIAHRDEMTPANLLLAASQFYTNHIGKI